MNTVEITLPEVTAHQQHARFYRLDNIDYVEISRVGEKDTNVRRVKPEDMARFKEAWDAFCDGRPPEPRKGTPLTDVASEEHAKKLVAANVHTLEELAALSDAQCQGIGHGTLTARKNARELLAVRQHQAREAAVKAIGKAAADAKPAPEAPAPELAEIKTQVAELTRTVGMLAELLAAKEAPRKGRKPKAEADAE